MNALIYFIIVCQLMLYWNTNAKFCGWYSLFQSDHDTSNNATGLLINLDYAFIKKYVICILKK